MPRTCEICFDRRDRAEIDSLILSGRSLLSISKDLDVGYGSLRGHVAHGHHLGVSRTPRYVPVQDVREVYVFAAAAVPHGRWVTWDEARRLLKSGEFVTVGDGPMLRPVGRT